MTTTYLTRLYPALVLEVGQDPITLEREVLLDLAERGRLKLHGLSQAEAAQVLGLLSKPVTLRLAVEEALISEQTTPVPPARSEGQRERVTKE